MEDEFPRRLFQAGYEPQVKKINNNCKNSVLKKLKANFPAEYNKVSSNSIFSQVLTLFENGLGYSAKLIYNMLCRDLVTGKQHELWFVFGGKPLRFSLQEFYAFTSLKCKDDNEIRNLAKWKDDTDNGFWSKLFKIEGQINMKTLLGKEQLDRVKKWLPVDRVRFVHICVIAGVIMGQDDMKSRTNTFSWQSILGRLMLVPISRSGKKKLPEHGAETLKKKILCVRRRRK